MPMDPQALKDIKNGNMKELSLRDIFPNQYHHQIDAKDWKALKTLVSTSSTLKSLDMSNMHGAFEQLSDSIKKSTSITKINLSGIVGDHHMPLISEVMKGNTNIREIVMENCHLYDRSGGITYLRRILEAGTLTHLSMYNSQHDTLNVVTRALLKSQNIMSFEPAHLPALEELCRTNTDTATKLAKLIVTDLEGMTALDVDNFARRLPATTHMLETVHKLDKKAMAELLLSVEDKATRLGTTFSIPETYKEITDWMPLPFHPSDKKVTFGAKTKLDAATLYKAAEAGQVDEMLAAMKAKGVKFTTANCLFKPADKAESLVALLARQSRLADVMSVANWAGDTRGMKEVAESVVAREWRRQMKDTSIEKLVSLVNAATLKTKRLQGPKAA